MKDDESNVRHEHGIELLIELKANYSFKEVGGLGETLSLNSSHGF